MRIPSRITTLCLGLVLIIVLLALPSLLHLLNPHSPSEDDATHALAHTPRQPISYAVFPVDRQIDELGAPSHIRTEADAKIYVEALMRRWDPNEPNPHVAEIEERLARAEYAAVRDPERLIPGSQIVKTFNRLMDKWQMPGWAQISIPELHAFRISYARAIYPRSVPRLPDESIAPGCRPTEALFLLHMLDSNNGIASYIRDYVRQSHFPWNVLMQLKLWHPTPIPVFQPGLHPAPPDPDALRSARYDTVRDGYFTSHPDANLESVTNEIFDQLGIPAN